MRFDEIIRLTPHPDVNGILAVLSERLSDLLGDQLVGLYLTGSLTYGDFDRGSSDIDFLAILSHALSQEQRGQVRGMHARIGEDNPLWAERIEGSYITKDLLENVEPPRTPRPYINGGRFWDPDPVYGYEWILNLYVLYECGVALVGPDPKNVMGPIDIDVVRRASKKDLYEEWVPKLKDQSFFEKSHHQAYVVLTLCRILHRATNDSVASKRVASAWVKHTYGRPWIALVERAEQWQHGQEMNAAQHVLDFIEFTREELNRRPIKS